MQVARKCVRRIGAAVAALLMLSGTAFAKTDVTFYYPISVTGPLTQLIDGYVAKFEAENPDIDVTAVYSGDAANTMTKAMAAAKSGAPPTFAMITAVNKFTLIDEDLIQPMADFIKTDEDKAWIASFMPAFLSDSLVDGKLWTVPFARSTAVLYYNKEAFAEAGLDPDKPPKTWDEMVTMGKLLTKKDASGKVTRWGVAIPGSVALAQWMFGALAAENGAKLVNSGGTETYFTDPKVVEALQYWVDLSKVHGIHPPGIQEWGTTPADFLEQRLAMAWTSSGNLANFRANAKFKFGVAPYPGKVTPASVLGGFNIYIFKGAPEASKEAGLKFIKFLTSRDIQADWSVNTGYVATRPDSWETDVMKAYVAKVPEAAIGRDQIKDSVPEISTYENDRVSIKALNDAIAAALTGAKTPEVALGEAQAEAERILKPYR